MLRKKNTAKKQNIGVRRITGVLLLACSAAMLAAYCGFFAGSVAEVIDTFQGYLLGKGAFLFPVILFILGYKALLCDRILSLSKRTLIFTIMTLCLIGTAHNIFVPVGEELYPQHLPVGGGIIGGAFVLIMHRTIGVSGSWAVLAAGWAIIFFAVTPFAKIKALLFKPKNKPAPVFEDMPETEQDGVKLRENNSRENVFAAKIKKAEKQTPKANIYAQEEFDEFTEGIKKETVFRRILNSNVKNTYSNEEVKKTIERDPVQLPEWEEEKTVPQPAAVKPQVKAEETIIDMPQRSFLGMQNSPVIDNAELPPKNEQRSFVINNIYQQNNKEAFTKEQEDLSKRKVTIFDSAEKIKASEDDVEAKENVVENIDAEAEEFDGDVLDDAVEAETEQGSKYLLPPLEILNSPKVQDPGVYEADIMRQCAILEQTLIDFRVKARVVAVTRGPSVTRFELEPAPGVKVSSVVNLADDIALKLAAPGVRIEAPIPGKAAIGIEVPNIKNDQVYFKEVVDTDIVREKESKLCIGLGKDISGNIIPADLSKMPHLLVAGSTGSGKSVCINTIIAGILYKANPDEVKLILVDPKVVELSNYNGIPHLLTPVVTDAKKAASALHWAVVEMERRYQLFADNHVREINSFNEQAQEKLPFIVIIIDELADLMMVAKVDVEDAILRLAQKARAAGIHLILATQRPSVDVITGIVKANIPSRIAFAVSSQTDSRTILDMGGAEKLLGKGDMLFYPIGYNKPVRVQGAFVSDGELNKIVDFIIKQSIPVNYSEEVTSQALECDSKNNAGSVNDDGSSYSIANDELFEDALRLVLDMGQASSSMLQRRFRIGYTRAARLVDVMEELGIVGQSVGSKPREVILSRQEVEERFLNHE